MSALYTAATGMAAQQLNVEVISNNIANMNTGGVQASARRVPGPALPDLRARRRADLRPGHHRARPACRSAPASRPAASTASCTQGALTRTDNQYDLAIDGRGYFQVLMPHGRHRLHAGRQPSSSTTRASWSPRTATRSSRRITIPPDADSRLDLQVGPGAGHPGRPDHAQRGRQSGAGHLRQRGRPERHGGNLFKETAASGAATTGTPGSVGIGTLVQGYTEASNVDAGDRDHRPDRRPARLRDELQGDLHAPTDALHHLPDVPQLRPPVIPSRPRDPRARRLRPRGALRDRLLHTLPALASGALRLRGDVTARGDILTLGDLVEGASAETGQRPLFRAPALGATGTIQARRIVEAVAAIGLGAVETCGRVQIAVQRAVRRVGAPEIEAAVKSSLESAYGLDPRGISIRLDGEMSVLLAPIDLNGQAAALDVTYDPRSRRITGLISLGERQASLRVSGLVVEMREIAVLTRTVNRGEPVTAADVAVEWRPREGSPPDAQSGITGIVGELAQRALSAGSVLRTGDTAPPELVNAARP